MRTAFWLGFTALCFSLALTGCKDGGPGQQKGTPDKLADTEVEYFCPMHPQIVGERPDKCPICFMPLSKREAAITKLSPDDRRLVEAQVFCPIREDTHLGTMGTPLKVLIKGQPVFLCCAGCKEKALGNPDQTLTTVAKLKAKAKTASPPK